ncbi:MAG TPA: preprotein translocase subunit YajC [Phycisphaerae bacterium]|nr:preprotein translocase subunit YajC [Phycisphaerae bacterium]
MQTRVMLMLLLIGVVSLAAAPVLAQETGPSGSDPGLVEKGAPPTPDQADQAKDGAAPEKGEPPTPSPDSKKEKPPGGLPTNFLLIMVGGFILLYFWMSRGKKKEKQRRKEMLESLTKGDKITTIGGVVGTVMNVKDDEVTIKVDESSNTRMTFARWAVRGVGESAKAEDPKEAEKKP